MQIVLEDRELLAAWIEPAPFRPVDVRVDDEPDYRLLVVSDEGGVLLVEIAHGTPSANGTKLWVEGRGSFEIAGVLSREGIGRRRTYMRLRASPLPSAA